jgi:hypothetical protein
MTTEIKRTRSQSPPPLAARLSLLSEAVGILGTAGACLYFYGRAYHGRFLRNFGLPGGVVPTSVQDVLADRAFDVFIKLVYLSSSMALPLLLYTLVIVAKHYLRFGRKPAPRKPRRVTWLTERQDKARADKRLHRVFQAAIFIVGVPVGVLFAAAIAGIAAESAADRDAGIVRRHVTSTCAQCAVYTVSGKAIVGLAIAGTEDRAFLLRRDGAITLVALDNLQSVRPLGVKQR